jgi:hypothetical protein
VLKKLAKSGPLVSVAKAQAEGEKQFHFSL